MSIEFNCNACGKLLRVPEGSAGKQAKCPHCNTVMRIPAASSDAEGLSPADPIQSGDTIESEGGFGELGGAPPSNDPLGMSGADSPGTSASEQNPFAEVPAGGAAKSAGASGGSFGQPAGNYGMHPHRAGMIMTFGIISVASSGIGIVTCCCCLFGVLPVAGIGFGIPAWMMGKADLDKMSQGIMDPAGYGNTKVGMTTGMIGTILGAVFLLSGLAWFIINMVFNLGSTSFQNPNF